MVSLLEAHGVPCLVHGGNLASMLPGLQIAFYNNPTIMVPESLRDQALELLSVFSEPLPAPVPLPWPAGILPKVRIVLEAILFGWPVSQPPVHSVQDEKR